MTLYENDINKQIKNFNSFKECDYYILVLSIHIHLNKIIQIMKNKHIFYC